MSGTAEHGYARAADGAYIAYKTVGHGPVDIVWQFDYFGNVDAMFEVSQWHDFYHGLAEFSRVILHDRRGTGASSRDVVMPNLETRVSDLLAVFDAVEADQPVVLAGQYEGGTPNILLAATRPELVRSIVWLEPSARSTWTSDYPWGVTSDYTEAEASALTTWGTTEYGRRFSMFNDETAAEDVDMDYAALVGKVSRQTCTPDAAKALAEIWYQTDVRDALPSVQAPALLTTRLSSSHDLEEARHIASLMSYATVETTEDTQPGREHVELIRRSLGVAAPRPSLDSVLATVLFTDIIDSTTTQAALGDREWKLLVERHHEIIRSALATWRGIENDTAGDGFYATFEGPARAIHCALEITDRVRALGIQIRAGIHVGECEMIDGKAGGIAVSIGARIGALAEPSQVLVSQTVKDLTAGSGIHYLDHGEHSLKGVPERWRVYVVEG